MIWVIGDAARLRGARDAVADPANTVFVSVVCAWEMAIKWSLGKLDLPDDPAIWLPPALATLGLTPLAIELRHSVAVSRLPFHHRDPFDRLLVAQARIEGFTIVTADRQLEPYGVPLLPFW